MNTHAVVEDEKRVETAVKERSRPGTKGPLASAAPDQVLFEGSFWIPVPHSAREGRGRLFCRLFCNCS